MTSDATVHFVYQDAALGWIPDGYQLAIPFSEVLDARELETFRATTTLFSLGNALLPGMSVNLRPDGIDLRHRHLLELDVPTLRETLDGILAQSAKRVAADLASEQPLIDQFLRTLSE